MNVKNIEFGKYISKIYSYIKLDKQHLKPVNSKLTAPPGGQIRCICLIDAFPCFRSLPAASIPESMATDATVDLVGANENVSNTVTVETSQLPTAPPANK